MIKLLAGTGIAVFMMQNISGASALILHFNMNAGSCPAVQFRVNYRNGGIFIVQRDGYGFEANWSEFTPQHANPLRGMLVHIHAGRM